MSASTKHPAPKPRACEDCGATKPVMLEMRGLPVKWNADGDITAYAPGWWLCVTCWIAVGQRMAKEPETNATPGAES